MMRGNIDVPAAAALVLPAAGAAGAQHAERALPAKGALAVHVCQADITGAENIEVFGIAVV